MPPLTDFVALLGIDLVLCAGLLRVLGNKSGLSRRVKLATAVVFVLMWSPAGAAQLPLLAYIRGISSDLSMTLVALACIFAAQQLFPLPVVEKREKTVLAAVIAATALGLYPLSLGWGDWGLYRTGWGSWGLLAALLAVSAFSWLRGLRLLPLLIGLSLFSWRFGFMESANLWDYLLDPWLAIAALFGCLKLGAVVMRDRWRARAAYFRP